MNSRTGTTNPYDYVNEVTNPALFAGRQQELSQLEDDIARLANAQATAPVSAIVGERRIGKTSLSLRVREICEDYGVVPLRVSLNDMTAVNPWDFWQEIFHGLIVAGRGNLNATTSNLGFRTARESDETRHGLTEARLEFFEAYGNRTSQVPQNYLINDGLRLLVNTIIEAGPAGVLLIIDEAHLLVESRIITQQLRFAIRDAGRCGVLFVGEPELAQLFADQEQPLFAQGRVIPINNFAAHSDVVECALLPLSDDERRLVSPMTIDYLVRLSQGKPNQIRLICHSIYNRFRKLEQTDLNITIEALDEVLENIAATYTEYDVRQRVETIRRLSSVDLEILYNMTRYPNWAVTDIIDLDESFRAEGKSLAASSRREAILREKREKFVSMGIMDADPHQFTLAGDEFLSLYLRFWYEISRHGQLSRSLVLGKGPATPFGEKTEKLTRFVVWELQRRPSIVKSTFSARDAGINDRVGAVKSRFSALGELVDGRVDNLKISQVDFGEWFRTCELVARPGQHHLLCLSVRNLESPRETMEIELYFDSPEIPLVISTSTLDSLRQRASDTKILVEAWDYFTVTLPSLNGLLETIGGPRLEEFMEQVGTLERWRLASVQHLVGSGDAAGDNEIEEVDVVDREEPDNWIDLYDNGKLVEAEDSVTLNLLRETGRTKRARLFNDRGYIRFGLEKADESKQDLQRALELHFSHLPLTLSNLAVAHIDEGNYSDAISHINDAIFLTLSAQDLTAAYLRLRLPTGYRAEKGQWEQNPANVLEASYINLSFALLQSGTTQDAMDVLQEGLDLMPSSARLKHALARLYLSQKRVDLAEPIYQDIANQPMQDTELANEVRLVLRSAPRQRSTRRRR